MEVVIIQGGVAQDTSKGVHVIDLDNLAEETEIAVLAATRDTARGAGMTWVVEEIDTSSSSGSWPSARLARPRRRCSLSLTSTASTSCPACRSDQAPASRGVPRRGRAVRGTSSALNQGKDTNTMYFIIEIDREIGNRPRSTDRSTPTRTP